MFKYTFEVARLSTLVYMTDTGVYAKNSIPTILNGMYVAEIDLPFLLFMNDPNGTQYIHIPNVPEILDKDNKVITFIKESTTDAKGNKVLKTVQSKKSAVPSGKPLSDVSLELTWKYHSSLSTKSIEQYKKNWLLYKSKLSNDNGDWDLYAPAMFDI